MLVRFARAFRTAVLAAASAAVVSAGLAAAQFSDPTGPGQAVSVPPPLCPRVVGCSYAEHHYPPTEYRFQMLVLCGANCTTQYWVSNIPNQQLLINVDPVRGGGIVAVRRTENQQNAHPPVRVVIPYYQQGDAACCPSQYRDATYTWDAAQGALVEGTPTLIPASNFPGWQAMQQRLESEQFYSVFHGA